jgi:uridine phosphorylase
MNGPLLFVAAEPREFSGWIGLWEDVKPWSLAVHWARVGKWKGRKVAAVANGAGAERAFAAVIVAGDVSAVCSIGFCGALDENLGIGDVVIATEVRNGAGIYPAIIPAALFACGVCVASIDHIAQTAAEKRNLRATGASVVEMEAAGVARACEDLNLPFYCVRAVSDLAGEDFVNDFNAALKPDGRFSVPRLVAGALVNPVKRFGELLRLKRRTAAASMRLGEFLATCEF